MAIKKKAKVFTIEQRTEMLLTPCKTRLELHKWIKYHLEMHLPDVTVSRYADTNPLDFIWELYQIIVLKKNNADIKEVLAVAGRGSGKTLGMAIVELLAILHDQRSSVHVGATQGQADRCYAYIKNFLYNRKIKDVVFRNDLPEDQRIVEKSNIGKTVFNVSETKPTIEVLPCTLKACNGPHVALCVIDEIDTVSGEGLKAFKEISGMLDTIGDKQALRVGISTRKTRYGLMNQQIENAEKQGRHLRKWTAFEFCKACPESLSGTLPTDYWVCQDNMEVIDEEFYKRIGDNKKKDYTLYNFPGEKCGKCPIAAICLGDAKKQTSKSTMLKPITDIIKKVLSEGADWALAQLMNLKPSVEGIVFKEYDPKIHLKNWNELWQILVGKPFPGECNQDIFVAKCHEMKLPFYSGVDWGWTNPNTTVYVCVDKKDNVYVVKTDGMKFISQPAWIHYLLTKYQSYFRCQLYFPDVADQGAVAEMKLAGLPVSPDVDKSINTGIQCIKKFLKVPGQTEPKIFLAKETTTHLQEEFNLYHYKTDSSGLVSDVPEDDCNHWIDALRYIMSMLFGKQTMMMATMPDESIGSPIDRNGNFNRTPTPSEFANSRNIQFDEHIDTSKIGKVGTLGQLDQIDEDESNGSSGNFLWEF